jgi:hydroxyacylglutathione hydrolase
MIVKRFSEPLIAQNSYLIGCAAAGEAIVIDPNRDVQQYIAAAGAANLLITHVTETHIHADFLSGARELAHRTGARLCLSDEGDQDWKYQFEHDRKIAHGDRMTIGNVAVDVLHTPGHTPESLTFLITDGAAANRPIAAITGDFVFVGDVGRPDLLEKAANLAGTMETGARTLWRSLQQFQQFPDWLQIWPGHGAGSSCGKGISAVPHSTIGYERRFNWAFTTKSEAEFVAKVLSGQPDPPPYFAVMKRVNKEGPPLVNTRPIPLISDDKLAQTVNDGLVIDTRPALLFGAGHLPGTLNIPMNSSFVTWAGWLIPYDREFHLIVEEGGERRLDDVRRALALIGLERIAGYFKPSAVSRAGGTETIDQMTVDEFTNHPSSNSPIVIDVRNDAEWSAGHIPNALHIPLGQLAQRIDEVPENKNIVVQCQGGGRSSIAASLLQKMGRKQVANLTGGYRAWSSDSSRLDTDT